MNPFNHKNLLLAKREFFTVIDPVACNEVIRGKFYLLLIQESRHICVESLNVNSPQRFIILLSVLVVRNQRSRNKVVIHSDAVGYKSKSGQLRAESL